MLLMVLGGPVSRDYLLYPYTGGLMSACLYLLDNVALAVADGGDALLVF